MSKYLIFLNNDFFYCPDNGPKSVEANFKYTYLCIYILLLMLTKGENTELYFDVENNFTTKIIRK